MPEETAAMPEETATISAETEEATEMPEEPTIRMRRPRKHSKIVIHVSHQTHPEIVEQQLRVVNEMHETVKKIEQHLTMFEAICEWLGCPRRPRHKNI